MLPGMDGFELCKEIKKKPAWAAIPVLMLTARAEEIDRVLGLELGADDYMVKPFSPRELVLRIKAILRRGESKQDTSSAILTVGKLVVDKSRPKVTVNAKEVQLTAMEFKLLVLLMERRGRVQSRERLFKRRVGHRRGGHHAHRGHPHQTPAPETGQDGQCIETVRGSGYRFCEESSSCD